METGGHDDEKTLDYIAANCDYALAEITIDAVDSETGNVTATGTASFANQQAIVKFSLKQPDGTTPLAATSLKLKVGGTTYNVTPTSAASDIYVAIKNTANKAVTLLVTDGTDYFRYEKSGVSFAKSQYYSIGVKMFSLNLSTFTSSYTAQDGDVLTGTLDGATQPYSISIADGATVTLSGVTINGSDNTSCDWAGITFTTGITSLTLKNSRADFSPPAGFYLNAGQVMAHTVDITKSLSGYNSYLSSFNERNPAFSELFPHSTFDADTKVWNIAP